MTDADKLRLAELAREYVREHNAFTAVNREWEERLAKLKQSRASLSLAMHKAGVAAAVLDGQSVHIDRDGNIHIERAHVVSPESPQ